MAYGKISKIDCDAAFYDDCYCRRRRDVGDSRGGPHPRSITPKGCSATGMPADRRLVRAPEILEPDRDRSVSCRSRY
jgi:hypothetical protein